MVRRVRNNQPKWQPAALSCMLGTRALGERTCDRWARTTAGDWHVHRGRACGHNRVVLEDGVYVIPVKPNVRPRVAPARTGSARRAAVSVRVGAANSSPARGASFTDIMQIEDSCSRRGTPASDRAGAARSALLSEEGRAMDTSLLRGFSATSWDEVTLQGLPSR